MLTFWLGFLTAAQLALTGAVAYVLYRYVYIPWSVMRKDMVGVVDLVKLQEQRLAEAVELVKMRSIAYLTDEELAMREKRAKQRATLRGGNG